MAAEPANRSVVGTNPGVQLLPSYAAGRLAFVVAGFLVLGSTTAPLHERPAFAGFVVVELVCASGEFWNSVFGEGRTSTLT
jgi:hypothetical protein